MKKKIAVGLAAVALAAVPMLNVMAIGESFTDTIVITINESCELTRKAYASGGVTNNTSHKNGTDGTWSTTANTNTLSATRANGTTTYSLGSSQFNMVCNHATGYKVTVATTSLVHGTDSTLTIPFSTSALSTSSSGWIVSSAASSSGTRYANGGTVKTASSPTAGTSFEVFYGVGISTTQTAGTYTGTATYTSATI
ncbi:hypothetical protein IKG33_01635 [Candidatus Saccharibacteria bacterium]|nr:hypothetical protein [Candidatus Saccharibacteria bacterium]